MQYLTEYQTFKSKQELNDAIGEHLTAHRYELSETVRNVLTVISRYAVKFPGAAHLKAATIAEVIGMSEKTVRRAINRLQALGIVSKVVTKRKVTGGQGANIMQILPCNSASDQADMSRREDAEEPIVPSAQPSEIKSEPYSSLKQNTVINNTYQAFKNTVGQFVDDRKLTNKLYGIYLAQTSYIRNCYEPTELQDCGIEALIRAFLATKRKPIRNMAGYYHGVLDRVLDRLYLTSVR